jgi:hypothetical protein
VPGAETVIQLLESHARVASAYDNDFVDSIDGYAGNGRTVSWFYYVNGTEAPQGAGTTPVRRGERIWWDLHDWRATDSIPAVVGSYPAPFTQGERRVLVACASGVSAACATVVSALERAGVAVTRRTLAGNSAGRRADQGAGSLVSARATDATAARGAIVVGTERELAAVPAARLIAAGPRASGVYARFADRGRTLELLSPTAATVTRLGTGAGLVAATAVGGSGAATWLITGTDPSGVTSAARALSPARLRDTFALALRGSRALALPLDPAS